MYGFDTWDNVAPLSNQVDFAEVETSDIDEVPEFCDIEDELDSGAVGDGGKALTYVRRRERLRASGFVEYVNAEQPNHNIVRTRTYDLTLTYDKYYQTPRVWLFGYDEVEPSIRRLRSLLSVC